MKSLYLTLALLVGCDVAYGPSMVGKEIESANASSPKLKPLDETFTKNLLANCQQYKGVVITGFDSDNKAILLCLIPHQVKGVSL